jgi:hypothetical protein
MLESAVKSALAQVDAGKLPPQRSTKALLAELIATQISRVGTVQRWEPAFCVSVTGAGEPAAASFGSGPAFCGLISGGVRCGEWRMMRFSPW